MEKIVKSAINAVINFKYDTNLKLTNVKQELLLNKYNKLCQTCV